MSDNKTNDLQNIVQQLKEKKWERKDRKEIEDMRFYIDQLKRFGGEWVTNGLKEILRWQLTGNPYTGNAGHAQDDIARRLMTHYLDHKGGKCCDLTLLDMKQMIVGTKPQNIHPMDLRKQRYRGICSQWNRAVQKARQNGGSEKYEGRFRWGWDNGAISTYTVLFNGYVLVSNSGKEKWTGAIAFYDRFDMDPRWDWSESNPGGRSPGGERRTRIGYMLNLGTDFNFKSPMAIATQIGPNLTLTGQIAEKGKPIKIER